MGSMFSCCKEKQRSAVNETYDGDSCTIDPSCVEYTDKNQCVRGVFNSLLCSLDNSLVQIDDCSDIIAVDEDRK